MAYEAIKEAIMQMQYKPGERIVIRDVASQIGTSDIPVREALNKLQSENLVEMEPHVGFRVKAVSDKNTFENLEIKYELESIAIRKTAENISEEALEKAAAKLEDLEKAARDKNYIEYFRGIREFNLMLYKNNGNDRLYEMLLSLFDVTNSLGTIYIMVPDWCEYSIKTHKEIFKLVKKREGEAAAEKLRSFKFAGLSKAVATLSEYGINADMEQEWMKNGPALMKSIIAQDKKNK